MRLARRAAVLSLAIAPAACGSPAPADDPNAYLAFASSFKGFHAWQSFALNSDPIPNSPHTTGARTVYLNAPPPHGATEFPVGTMIVKQFADPPTIFAMVKRGGGYNALGAAGWEWFELKAADDDSVAIVWRGVGPPLGEKYGGDPNGGCNGCHGAARGNDFVQARPLTLSTF
jgi:hypothetical protein